MDWKIWDGMKLFCKTEYVANSTFTLLIFQCIYFTSFDGQAVLILWWIVIIDSLIIIIPFLYIT